MAEHWTYNTICQQLGREELVVVALGPVDPPDILLGEDRVQGGAPFGVQAARATAIAFGQGRADAYAQGSCFDICYCEGGEDDSTRALGRFFGYPLEALKDGLPVG